MSRGRFEVWPNFLNHSVVQLWLPCILVWPELVGGEPSKRRSKSTGTNGHQIDHGISEMADSVSQGTETRTSILPPAWREGKVQENGVSLEMRPAGECRPLETRGKKLARSNRSSILRPPSPRENCRRSGLPYARASYL